MAAALALLLAATTAGSAAAQEKKKAPPRPGAVTVQVLMLTERHARNPEEYLEVGGKRYIYFDSPRLVE
ncbi:MAG: hypothetical protein NZ518_11805, partial [Dehalococcoidia bacterium]|nr:hypothetical protein [Dehalococcoidia bacterium]